MNLGWMNGWIDRVFVSIVYPHILFWIWLQYEDAPKKVAESIANSSKRVQDKSKADLELQRQEQYVDVEKEKHSQLIGQLK